MTQPAQLPPAACPACGQPLAHAVSVCTECGAELFAATRRVVTVLFADLAGYTRLCSTMDVEEVHLLVRPLMNALRRTCEVVGGVVPVIEGDGFMAVFGARAGREDDPERAVMAAVEMQGAVSQRRGVYGASLPGLRIGINLGEALVAPSWEQGGFSVTGDTVNVASRLCALADEDCILGSADLVAVVASPAWGHPRQLDLRNRELSVDAYRLDWRSLTSSAQLRRAPSAVPFVERAAVAQPVGALLADGGSLLVVGEPGMGKTRVLLEAAQHAGGRSVLWAAGSSYGRQDPLRALAAQLGDLGELGAEEISARRLRRLKGEAVDSDEIDAPEDQADALVKAVLSAAKRAPLLLVVDDVQWLPEHALGALAALLAAVDARLAVLCSARSEWPGDLSAARVEIPALTGEGVAELVGHLLPGAPPSLVEVIERRCGGVPLYLEQCVQLLVDDGTVTVGLEGTRLVAPEQLRRLPVVMRLFVSSRLDALDPEARETLATAAVVGDVLDVDLLRYLTGKGPAVAEVVERLVDRGLLHWSRGDQGPVLQFRHQVVRDVAYETMLRARRAELHRAAAEWYAVLPVAAVLAEEATHLEAAIALGAPSCELVRRAVAVLSFHALGVLEERPRDAAEALRRAQELVSRHPECDPDLLDLCLGLAHVRIAEGLEREALSWADRAEQLAAERGDVGPRALALLLKGRATAYGEPAQAERALAAAEALFSELGDGSGLARVELERANIAASLGLAPRLDAHERAWVMARRAGDNRLAALAAQDLAMHMPNRDLHAAREWRQHALDSMRPDDVLGRGRVSYADALVASLRGERRRARTSFDAVRTAGREAGSQHLQLNATVMGLEQVILDGARDDAAALLAEARAVAATRPTRRLGLDLDMHEALLLSRTGQVVQARALLTRAQAEAEGVGLDFQRQAHAFRARIDLDSGHFGEAIASAEKALALDQQLQQPMLGAALRLVALAGKVAARVRIPLSEGTSMREMFRAAGAPVLAELTARWFREDDLLQGYDEHLSDVGPTPDLFEARALDLEVSALHGGRPELLLEAAEQWAGLGTTVWQARALLWHSELTGGPHPEADELLALVAAPEGLAARLREQVQGVRR